MWKYIAKFRLLERGLLDAAQGVDDLHIRVSGKASSKAKKKQADRDEEDSEEDIPVDQPDIQDETPQEFIMRVNLYVAVHLSRASGSKRDHYKDALVFQTRKDLINEFLKGTLLNKCNNSNCGRSVSKIIFLSYF